MKNMRNFWLLAFLFILVPVISPAQETTVEMAVETKVESTVAEATFWVRGNCGSCEKRIERTLKKIDGVSEAEWDQESGDVTVTFDPAKTNQDALETAVAEVGHATKKYEADEEKHDSLPKCCREGFGKHND